MEAKFKLGDVVRKTKGSQWSGTVVGTYSTSLTPEGYAVESSTERGSVQIYPAAALELVPAQEVPEDVQIRERIALRLDWLAKGESIFMGEFIADVREALGIEAP